MRYLRTPSLRWSLLAVVGLAALVAAAVLLGQGGIARASHTFSDVPDSAFYHDFVAFLADNGITSGCGGGRFCGEDPVTRGQMAVFLQKVATVISARVVFGAKLSGAEEVPPVGTSTVASVKLALDDALSQATFRLVVNNGVNVTMAHLHCHSPGQNGPIAVFLFGPVAGMNVNGELASGTLTNASIAGSASGCAAAIGMPVDSIASLVAAARNGLIYANVHTVTNGGGEVRGQLIEQ
jgi:hypothetical protein